MRSTKRILTIVLTIALGLGVWTLAFTYTAADFSDGDVLSAAELNNLLNDNFDAAATAVGDLDARVGTVETDVSDLQTEVDGKVDQAGDAMSGQLRIEGDAAEVGDFTPDALFYAENQRTGAEPGLTALFEGNTDDDDGVVSIKNTGTGPALTLKSGGGGPLLSGASAGEVTFLVDVDGTVTNAVGSGLPLAFGYVAASGTKQSGTSNFTSTRASDGTYEITIEDETYERSGYVTIVQGVSPGRFNARVDATAGGDLTVNLFNTSDTLQDGAFYFVTFKDGQPF